MRGKSLPSCFRPMQRRIIVGANGLTLPEADAADAGPGRRVGGRAAYTLT